MMSPIPSWFATSTPGRPLGIPSFPFFFYCHRYHRDLHSFPTRRSSDLAGLRTLRAIVHEVTQPAQPPGRLSEPPRSEEHTSELQSHHDLVCRLLLEKKKISATRFPSPHPRVETASPTSSRMIDHYYEHT